MFGYCYSLSLLNVSKSEIEMFIAVYKQGTYTKTEYRQTPALQWYLETYSANSNIAQLTIWVQLLIALSESY